MPVDVSLRQVGRIGAAHLGHRARPPWRADRLVVELHERCHRHAGLRRRIGEGTQGVERRATPRHDARFRAHGVRVPHRRRHR